jgi:hypothetical protein
MLHKVKEIIIWTGGIAHVPCDHNENTEMGIFYFRILTPNLVSRVLN